MENSGRNVKEEMGKKCIYCGIEVPNESVIDFCEPCGTKAFGSKMYSAVIENMGAAEDRGDLDQGGALR